MTARQAEILAYMREHLERQQRLPTLRELCSRFEVGGVHGPLKGLIRDGHVLPSNGLARGYRLAGVRVVLIDSRKAVPL